MLLFMWQLFVLFASPFISAQNSSKSISSKVEFSKNITQIEEGTTISDGQSNVFVEEVLEEEVQPAESLKMECAPEFMFHCAVEKLGGDGGAVQDGGARGITGGGITREPRRLRVAPARCCFRHQARRVPVQLKTP